MIRSLFLVAALGVAATFATSAFAQEKADKKASAPVTQKAAKIPDTLMFTIDEYNDIQGRLSKGGNETDGKSVGEENVSLYLSTIVYYGPQDWTVWINGAPIGPGDSFQTFKVTSIAPSYVELLVPLSAEGMRPIRLGPNQTFVSKTGVVVEGRQQ